MKLYLNLFDFDQLLFAIQIGFIEVTCISHTLNTENDKDSSIISNTTKDTKVNFERLLSTTLFSIKPVLSVISTQDLLKNLEETLNYFKSTFNVQKRSQFCTLEDENVQSTFDRVILNHADFRQTRLCHVQFDNTDLSYANFNGSTLGKVNFTSKTILIRSSCSQAQLSISALFGVAGKYKEGTVKISSPTIHAYFDSPCKK
ncbi:unnamed protein product [Rotaria sordida]|uniref:Pentapeptide repeat-containing protein n=1 Tax=Rotaria sordida TaxID=392033 RepID=A0A816CHR2_9BILA|nr:unnamed protein product [Rotaria sordida]CAF1621481.1 unnamed protein product [Rotaria sordida]